MAKMNLGPRRMGKKSDRAKIITKLDQAFSEKVRKRDGSCRYCGKSSTVYCHHIFSRRHLGTRWDPENGVALCIYCHRYIAHGDPEKFRDWVLSWMPEQKFTALKIKAYSPAKFRESDLSLMLHLMKCPVLERPDLLEAF